MIDSETQNRALQVLAEYMGAVLGESARKAVAAYAEGPKEPANYLYLAYTGDYGWSYPDFLANSSTNIVGKLAEMGLTIAPDDGAVDAVVITAA